MAGGMADLVARWMERLGIDPGRAPHLYALETGFPEALEPCRPGASPREIADWEERHGYRFPAGLRAWLQLSNGLYRSGPLIHPISAIGPMIPFARVPEMIVQPESWFELGNPNLQTVCVDLAYRLPGGGHPVFTSGDDAGGSPPRIIAAASRSGSSSCCARGVANTGSTRISRATARPGPRTAAMCPGPISATACAASPTG